MRLGTAVVACCCAVVAGCGSSDDDRPVPNAAQRAPAAPSAAGACARATGGAAPTSVPGAPLDTILRVPVAARGHRAPLVLALHFASGSGTEMERVTRLTPEARRSGFVVAYPTATRDGVWQPDTDLPKLARTIAAIERAACVDRRRVYVAGISNGGGMGSVMACRMADAVAALALFAPAVGTGEDCAPSRPVSVLELHGTADPIVPYADGRAFIAAWAKRDGCAARPATRPLGARASRLRWAGCRAGAHVEHVRLSGAKHIELLDQLRAAKVDPARTAWRFLAAHPLP